MPDIYSISLLHLILTRACNLRCSYCYQSRDLARPVEWEVLRRAMDWALRVTRPGLEIAFSGGEPLLALPLIRRAVDYARERADPERGLQYWLLTNGLLLDDPAIDFLSANAFHVQLSFDGLRVAQEMRARGTFDRLDDLLDRLRLSHPEFCRQHLTVAMTLVPEAIPFLADSVAYLLDKAVPEIAIAPAAGVDGAWDAAQRDELEAQFERILDVGLRHFRASGSMPLLLLRGKAPASAPRYRCGTMCGVVRGMTPAVDVDGRVYACALLVEQLVNAGHSWFSDELRRLRIGDLCDTAFEETYAASVEKAWGSEILTRKENKRSAYGRCADCSAFAECGICPVSIGLLPGNQDPNRVPDLDCAFMQAASRARERFHREIDPSSTLPGSEERDSRPDPITRFLGQSDLPPTMRRVKAMADAMEETTDRG
jgi:uncharacterized protein